MAMLSLCLVLASVVACRSRELWSKTGEPGSLQRAVDAAAELPTATIHLTPGVHRLTQPLRLDARHSGTRFVGHGHSIVSGGVAIGADPTNGGKNISGWSKVPGSTAKCAGCLGEIWTATTPKGLDSRQFYVNGVRANRTWAPFPAGGTKDPHSNVITVPGGMLQDWNSNVTAIELVYRGAGSAGSQWQESRCPVAAIGKEPSQPGTEAMNDCAADYCPNAECPQDPPTGSPINRSSCGAGITPCICTEANPVRTPVNLKPLTPHPPHPTPHTTTTPPPPPPSFTFHLFISGAKSGFV